MTDKIKDELAEKEAYYRDYYTMVEAISDGKLNIDELFKKYDTGELASIVSNTINMGFISLTQFEEIMQFIINMLYYSNIAIIGSREYTELNKLTEIFNVLARSIVEQFKIQVENVIRMEDIDEKTREIFDSLLGNIIQVLKDRAESVEKS